MDTTARHPFIIPPTPQATRPVQLCGRLRQAMPWRRFDNTGHGYVGRKISTGKARKSRNKISVACNAIMSVQYVILYYIAGPTCRDPAQCTCSPWTYKRESTPARTQALSDTALSHSLETKGTQAIQYTVDVWYYAPAARTTLNLLCSLCSCI